MKQGVTTVATRGLCDSYADCDMGGEIKVVTYQSMLLLLEVCNLYLKPTTRGLLVSFLTTLIHRVNKPIPKYVIIIILFVNFIIVHDVQKTTNSINNLISDSEV